MSVMKEHISDIVEAIDYTFGEGYARKNPELVGRLIQAEHLGFGLYQIAAAIGEIEDEPYTM